MAGYDQRKDWDENGEEVYSRPVRAGKRTYFFDVKATRGDDYYLTITESRKKPGRDGGVLYEKHKIFLYKEDFANFAEGLEEVISYVKRHRPEFFEAAEAEGTPPASSDGAPRGGFSAGEEERKASMSIDEEFDSL